MTEPQDKLRRLQFIKTKRIRIIEVSISEQENFMFYRSIKDKMFGSFINGVSPLAENISTS